MPVGAFSIQRLNYLLGGEGRSGQDLVEALENLGCDVEGTDTLVWHRCPRCGTLLERFSDQEPVAKCRECGLEEEEPFASVGEEEVIRLDLLADRPDLLDIAGLARALKGYLEMETGLPQYSLSAGEVVLEIQSDFPQKRPHIGVATVELPVDGVVLREMMRLQESLHWAIGRDRKLASIGVYDLSTLTPPIYYTSRPRSFRFCPLGMPGEEMTVEEILEKHPKGVNYRHLLEGWEHVPILIDAQGQVLSMPPIINSEETKVREGSSLLFVDVTGTDAKPVKDTLKTFLASLIELGGKVHSVKVNLPNGETQTWPSLQGDTIVVSRTSAEKWLGIELPEERFLHYLAKMRLQGKPVGEDKYEVTYPPYRSDIRHPVDIYEDLIIAHGYANIAPTLPQTVTFGQERPEERLSQLVRTALCGLGFLETMSLMQTTEEKHFHRLDLPLSPYVEVENPKIFGQKVLRQHLFSGLLEVFQKNRLAPKPQSFFEIGNVILLAPQTETGTKEERRVAFGISDVQVGYADGRAVMDALLHELGEKGEYAPLEHPSFLPGRCASVKTSRFSGLLGEVHPKVLNAFEIPCPLVLAELTLMEVI